MIGWVCDYQGAQGSFCVLLIFAFCSEDADLQFSAGHLAKAERQMWHS